MKALHRNILKLMNQIINETAANIQTYSSSKHDFTRNRMLNAIDLIKSILYMQGNSLSDELLHLFPDIYQRMTVSAYEQQKDKLKLECFKHIMTELNKAIVKPQLLDGRYLTLAIDGSDFDPPFNPKSENILRKKDGSIYCQIHVNALYDLLNKTYLNCVFQPKKKMDERSAAIVMLKKLDQKGHNFLVLMDRGYTSFNMIENCNRLKNCAFVIRTKNDKSSFKEIKELPDKECDLDLSCRVTDSGYYYLTHKNRENIHLIHRQRRHYKAAISKNTEDTRWDFGAFCNVKFRVCKIRINPPGTKDEWEVLLTNLNRKEFPLARMKEIYRLRWGIETSFRGLKYDIGAVNFHSKKDKFVYMELYAHLIMYNAVSLSLTSAQVPQAGRKHKQKIDFKMACSAWHHHFASNDFSNNNFNNLLLDMESHLVPIKPGRKYKRNLKVKLTVAFLYRVAA